MTQQAGSIDRDQTGLGIVLIVLSVLAMSFSDAVVKLVSADMSVWQVFLARSLIAAPILAVGLRMGGMVFHIRSWGWVVIRCLLLVLTWLAFYAALPVLDLSLAAVAVYTNPIITALLAAVVLGERVSRWQWLGVLTGFAGVVAILRPGTDAFSWAALLPLLAALFYSSAMVVTRSKCRDEQPFTLSLMLHVSFIVVGGAAIAVLELAKFDEGLVRAYGFLLNGWQAMGVREWGLMALIGILAALYFAGVAKAYQITPMPVVATFDYAYLVWAAMWGFLFFTEIPDGWTIAGMVLITVTGLLVSTRKSQA